MVFLASLRDADKIRPVIRGCRGRSTPGYRLATLRVVQKTTGRAADHLGGAADKDGFGPLMQRAAVPTCLHPCTECGTHMLFWPKGWPLYRYWAW